MQNIVQLTRSIDKLSLKELIWLLQYIVGLLQKRTGTADDTSLPIAETTLLSEPALAEDWNKPDEDDAWSHLQ
ncbi:hypothetical protein QUF63_09890 [Anaerolineales bacterium HSG25]|nr:hypothetical protein [Anaerolineales bacterium HSG25]